MKKKSGQLLKLPTGTQKSMERPGTSKKPTSLTGTLGVKSKTPTGIASATRAKVDRLDPIAKGQARLAELKQRALAQQRQQLIERLQEKLGKVVRLRLAIVIDFTASTSGDISNLRREAGELQKKLIESFKSVDILPIAARGISDANGVDVLTGSTNNLSWFNTVENVAYYCETPVAYGVKEAAEGDFFTGNPDQQTLQAIVTLSDTELILPQGYHSKTIPTLKQSRIALASLLTSQSEDDLINHKEAITETLGERGIVVVRSSEEELNAVRLIYEFIFNQRDNFINPLVEATLRKIEGKKAQGAKVPKISLADRLRKMGHTQTASKVSQGVSAKQIGS